ncbi:hypothetical protein VE02_04099 [Pseudogymnoascus sp. 03VT05]|nr:hypothetical protein VE02_04099 [Pseudogymnoascus sp. 03VT05]
MAILPAIDRDLERPLSIDKKSTVIRPKAWLKWLLLLLPGFWASRTAQVRYQYNTTIRAAPEAEWPPPAARCERHISISAFDGTHRRIDNAVDRIRVGRAARRAESGQRESEAIFTRSSVIPPSPSFVGRFKVVQSRF